VLFEIFREAWAALAQSLAACSQMTGIAGALCGDTLLSYGSGFRNVLM